MIQVPLFCGSKAEKKAEFLWKDCNALFFML